MKSVTGPDMELEAGFAHELPSKRFDMHLVMGTGCACVMDISGIVDNECSRRSTDMPIFLAADMPASLALAVELPDHMSAAEGSASKTPSSVHGMPRSSVSVPSRKPSTIESSCHISLRSRIFCRPRGSLANLEAAGESGPVDGRRRGMRMPRGVAGLHGARDRHFEGRGLVSISSSAQAPIGSDVTT